MAGSYVKPHMPRFFAELGRRAFMLVTLAGSALITTTSLAYFDFETLPAFVIEKLPLRFESLWLVSLRLHVAVASLTLPLCLLLMTRFLQRRPLWHRWLGRVTGTLILLALVPSGVVLAFDAKGGAPVTVGFVLSAAIVAGFMLHGVGAARRRDFAAHRRAMAHVVAQMSVAVTSRALIVGLDAWGVDPDFAYVVALWGPVVGSAAVVELARFRREPRLSPLVQSLERIRREISRLALPVRLRTVVRPVPRLGP